MIRTAVKLTDLETTVVLAALSNPYVWATVQREIAVADRLILIDAMNKLHDRERLVPASATNRFVHSAMPQPDFDPCGSEFI